MTFLSSTRHAWLSIFAVVSLAVCAPVWAKRPNIVVLLADDWGYSDVGAFGSEIHTPHLNQLAQSGTRFSNFHVSA